MPLVSITISDDGEMDCSAAKFLIAPQAQMLAGETRVSLCDSSRPRAIYVNAKSPADLLCWAL